MSEAQAEKAVQRLYENVGLRGELTDDEAAVLLTWGEAQVAELAARGLDDEAFDAQFATLSRLIAGINVFTGKREGMPPDAQQTALAEISALAQDLHYEIVPREAEAASDQPKPLSNIEVIQALTAQLKPPENPV